MIYLLPIIYNYLIIACLKRKTIYPSYIFLNSKVIHKYSIANKKVIHKKFKMFLLYYLQVQEIIDFFKFQHYFLKKIQTIKIKISRYQCRTFIVMGTQHNFKQRFSNIFFIYLFIFCFKRIKNELIFLSFANYFIYRQSI